MDVHWVSCCLCYHLPSNVRSKLRFPGSGSCVLKLGWTGLRSPILRPKANFNVSNMSWPRYKRMLVSGHSIAKLSRGDTTPIGCTLDELKAMVLEGSLQGPICSRTCAQVGSLIRHLNSHVANEGKDKCPYCPTYAGTSAMNLRAHIYLRHHDQCAPRAADEEVACLQCDRSVARRSMESHIATCDKNLKFPCTLCSDYAGNSQVSCAPSTS